MTSSFSTSTSSFSDSSLTRFRPRPPRFSFELVDDGEGTGTLVDVVLIRELFLNPDSESSSSESDSPPFFVEVLELCLFNAGDPVREPLDVTDEGVPALDDFSGLVADDPGWSTNAFFDGVLPTLGPGFLRSGTTGSSTCSSSVESTTRSLDQDKFSLILDLLIHSSCLEFHP